MAILLSWSLTVCSLSFFLAIFLFPTIFTASETPLSFNFPNFDSNHPEIYTEKDATVSSVGIELTRNQRDLDQGGSIGRATYVQPLHLWDISSGALTNFTTHFSFIINSDGDSNYGDGLAFFLAPNGSRLPLDVVCGGGLGLAINDNSSHALNYTENHFVAVEFDTYHNVWDPHYTNDHVGINVRSMKSVKAVRWQSSVEEGNTTDVWISYDSRNKILYVTYSFIDYDNSILQNTLSADVDMAKHLPEWVTFGFSASTGLSYEINRILSWDFNSSSESAVVSTPPPSHPVSAPANIEPAPAPNPDESRNSKTKIVVGFTVAGFSLIIITVGFFLYLLRKKKKGKRGKEVKTIDPVFSVSFDDDFKSDTGPRNFSYKELANATNNFSEEALLGEGGFGAVYRGFLKELNCYVAVKRVSRRSKQGIKEFAAEVKIISRMRHRNLVKLIGWCHEKELLLAYEFMHNGSLDCHLFKGKSLLTWEVRYTIAQGLASALLYLHEEGDQCVLHRDIKSSNIMLDSNFNAKLGDFGLARLVDHGKGFQTTVLAGTMGYMAPECFTTGKASKESDIYSFGVVALEIACGRRAVESGLQENRTRIVEWVWKLYGIGQLLQAADPKLCRNFHEQEMERLMVVGLWCVHPDQTFRPPIRQVINVLLSSDAPLPILPPEMPVAAYLAPLKLSISSLLSYHCSTSTSNTGEPTYRIGS